MKCVEMACMEREIILSTVNDGEKNEARKHERPLCNLAPAAEQAQSGLKVRHLLSNDESSFEVHTKAANFDSAHTHALAHTNKRQSFLSHMTLLGERDLRTQPLSLPLVDKSESIIVVVFPPLLYHPNYLLE